jgi:PAS domain S-box-containing protein
VSFHGRIVHAGAAVAALLGIPHAEDLLGRHVLDVVAPQSRAAATERMRPTACEGAPRSQVLVLSHANGSEVPAEVTTASVDWNGQRAVRIELRHTPDQSMRFRHLVTGVLSEVTDAVIVTDMQFHIRSWNAAAERIYGWSEPEVLGRHILDVVEWVDHDEMLSSVWARIADTGHWHGEGHQRTRDRLTIAVRATISLVRDAHGTPIGIASVNRPVGTDAVVPTSDPDADDIADLRRGIANNELDVHYQPVVDLATHRIITVEALVRWHHPTRGLLSPDSFMAIAERSGLIVDLGTYVLSTASRQIATWREDGLDVTLAVNLSAKELADPHLVERVTATVTTAGLEPTALWLEVTETALVEDVEQASILLHRLAALGIGISIDDFGTGWASLTYLRQFPVHVLKIDCSFVAGLNHDEHSTAIVRSILSLGAELGLIVIAEGIETTAHADALRELGCSIGQGYLYGRPTPADEIDLAHMHRQHPRPNHETVGALPRNTTLSDKWEDPTIVNQPIRHLANALRADPVNQLLHTGGDHGDRDRGRVRRGPICSDPRAGRALPRRADRWPWSR